MITQVQLQQIEKWLYTNARPLEIAKWNLIFDKGTKTCLVDEMLKYQNVDGGFGGGFEPDIHTPDSTTISSAEAIILSQDFGLDLSADWAKNLLSWYENTVKDTPDIWERVPKSIYDHPHAHGGVMTLTRDSSPILMLWWRLHCYRVQVHSVCLVKK